MFINYDLEEHNKDKIEECLADLIDYLSRICAPTVEIYIQKRGKDDIYINLKGTETEYFGTIPIWRKRGVSWNK